MEEFWTKSFYILETLHEIALFLDTPIFLIQEEKTLLSDAIPQNTELLFVFESRQDKDTCNKQGEKVLEKLFSALLAKFPTLTNVPKTEIVVDKHWVMNFEQTNVRYVVIFGETIASMLLPNTSYYQIAERSGIFILPSRPLETIENQLEEKKALWNSLLSLFASL